jgi:pyruvate/2-oxoglutarate dehydrogenase complex dihydrolipoamide acyltransferase (E2) component
VKGVSCSYCFWQSAILGMHSIVSRPAVVGGNVVPRPLMYIALTYDHRIIDGREAVFFLRRIKDTVEHSHTVRHSLRYAVQIRVHGSRL